MVSTAQNFANPEVDISAITLATATEIKSVCQDGWEKTAENVSSRLLSDFILIGINMGNVRAMNNKHSARVNETVNILVAFFSFKLLGNLLQSICWNKAFYCTNFFFLRCTFLFYSFNARSFKKHLCCRRSKVNFWMQSKADKIFGREKFWLNKSSLKMSLLLEVGSLM